MWGRTPQTFQTPLNPPWSRTPQLPRSCHALQTPLVWGQPEPGRGSALGCKCRGDTQTCRGTPCCGSLPAPAPPALLLEADPGAQFVGRWAGGPGVTHPLLARGGAHCRVPPPPPLAMLGPDHHLMGGLGMGGGCVSYRANFPQHLIGGTIEERSPTVQGHSAWVRSRTPSTLTPTGPQSGQGLSTWVGAMVGAPLCPQLGDRESPQALPQAACAPQSPQPHGIPCLHPTGAAAPAVGVLCSYTAEPPHTAPPSAAPSGWHCPGPTLATRGITGCVGKRGRGDMTTWGHLPKSHTSPSHQHILQIREENGVQSFYQ